MGFPLINAAAAVAMATVMTLLSARALAQSPAPAQVAPPTAAPAPARDRVIVVRMASATAAPKISEIGWGDRVRTGPGETAKILYSDGSVLLVAQNSELIVQAKQGGTQHNRLAQGEVRGIITKPEDPAAASPKAPPRFLIRSKAATMGVRGTDFTMELNPQGTRADVHTFEGQVQVVPGEASGSAMSGGEGVFVGKGEAAEALGGKVGAAKPFDVAQYMQAKSAGGVDWSAISRSGGDVPYSVASMNEKPEPQKPRLSVGNFELSALVAANKYHGQSSSVATTALAWTPRANLLGPLGIRLLAGAFPLKSDQGAHFFAAQGGALVSLAIFDRLMLEAGGGLEAWSNGRGRFGPLVMADAGWLFGAEGLLDRIFARASIYDGPSKNISPTAQVQLGMGVKL